MAKPMGKLKKPFKAWVRQQNRKLDPIQRDYYKYFGNLLSNSAYRIILSIFFFIGLICLSYFYVAGVQHVNTFGVAFISFMFFMLIYVPVRYVWTSYNQLSYEIELNKTISVLKWRIKRLSQPSGKKNYRSLQAGITELRTNLVGFLDNSQIISLPISSFEVNRLKQRIDIFFNCASETLVPVDKLFSLADLRDKEFYGEPPEEDEDFENYEFGKTYAVQQERGMSGQFNEFDLQAMDEFLDYLWDVLFDREVKRYNIFSYKHPINLILLSRFFANWNVKIGTCNNCKQLFAKAAQDIEAYYKSVRELEGENRQRKWKLRDDAIIVIVSVSLSTLIQYLINLA